MISNLDVQKVSQDQKLIRQLQPGQIVILSAKLIKINRVNKQQKRILLLTNKNIYNILPNDTFLGLFSRIKRKIPYSKIIAMTVSRLGSEFVVHVENEYDYRFLSPNLKCKIVETLVECYCRDREQKMAVYYYDDLSLQRYTTTADDVGKNQKKLHPIKPVYLQANSIKRDQQMTGDNSIILGSYTNKENIKMSEEFALLKVLGRGTFGKVMLCRNKKNNKYYAIKSMRKEELIEKQQITKIKAERYLLQNSAHPFLVKLQYSFKTKEKIFFVMQFVRGGEMFTHLRKCKRFPQKRAKFYAAQIYLALSFLHELGYVYRDLKPQNILLDIDGYLKVSDYGLAKQLKLGEMTYSLDGTYDYMSPQIITNKGHTFMTDWWSFGTLIYEMIYGIPPFYNRNHSKMFQDIVNRQLFFDNSKVQASKHCKDLIYSLLNKDPAKRIGAKEEADIKNHPWFQDMDWDLLFKREIKPDFVPVLDSQMDVNNFDQTLTSQQPVNSYVCSDLLLLHKFEEEFSGMDYNAHQNESFQETVQESLVHI